jgi:hypothetical protein
MKVYEFIFDENKNDFLKVSVVKDAAVETKLMAFSSEEEKPMYFANEEKREIYCVAMVPNKMIFRKDINGEPAMGYFTAESIERFQQHYFRTASNRAVNINHDEKDTTGVFPFESWIVKDSTNDKSNVIGLSAENGSLVMAFKVENDEVWEQCKNGNLDGLSIEARLDTQLKKSNFKTEIHMSKPTKLELVIDAIKSVFASDVEEETKEDVVEDEKPKEEMADEVPAEVVEEVAEEVKEDTTELKAENEMLKAEVAELKTKLADMEADKVKAETDLETMKKQTPKADPIPQTPKVEFKKDFKDMTPLEQYRFKKEINK